MALGVRKLASSALAIAGGALMVVGGVASHSFLLSILGLVDSNLPNYVSGIPLDLGQLSILVVSVLIGLGGITVIAGGVMILAGHVTVGRLLIMLGGGAGFLGLLVSFGYTAFTSGIANALGHAYYWIGLILAVVGRRVAKGA